MAILEAIMPRDGVKMAILDNGDTIPYDRFAVTAELIKNDTQDHGSNDFNISIKTDPKTGLPFLPTEKSNQQPNQQHKISPELSEIVVSPEVYQANDPVVGLLNKAKHTEANITITIPIQLIDKQLYNVIATSFEDGKATIHNHLVSKINNDAVSKAIKEEIEKQFAS
jgi:hypothetical protein